MVEKTNWMHLVVVVVEISIMVVNLMILCEAHVDTENVNKEESQLNLGTDNTAVRTLQQVHGIAYEISFLWSRLFQKGWFLSLVYF